MAKIRNFVANNKKKVLASFLISIILSGLIPFIFYILSFQNPEALLGTAIILEFGSFPLGTIIAHTVIKLNYATMKFLCDFDLAGEQKIYTEEEENARIISSQSREEILNPPFRVGETYYECGNGILSTIQSQLLIVGLSAFINIFIVSFGIIYLLEKIFKNKRYKKSHNFV